jgi:predicted permease
MRAGADDALSVAICTSRFQCLQNQQRFARGYALLSFAKTRSACIFNEFLKPLDLGQPTLKTGEKKSVREGKKTVAVCVQSLKCCFDGRREKKEVEVMMGTLWQDLQYGIRMLLKHRGFTLVAVLVLALGIGANAAIFSLVNAAILRPLPGVEGPDRLVLLERLQKDRLFFNFGYPDYLDYRDRARTLAGLAAHVGTPLSFSGGTTERIRGDLVTGNYFTTLGVRPALGRLLLPEDDGPPGAHPVAVLSYGFWQQTFGAEPQVIGREIALNNHNFTIVGVAAEGFGGTMAGTPIDLWLPLAMQPQAIPRMSAGIFHDRSAGWLGLFGRLKPGVGVEQAQAEMKAIARQLEQSYPGTNEGRSLQMLGGLGYSSDDRVSLRRILGLLLAAVVLLLLISCGNVANLLLVRAASRRREIAVRLALGATRGRLVRQLLTEGLLLSLLAGIFGLLLAPWTAALVAASQQSSSLFRGLDLSPDWRVLGFTLALSVLTGVVFGLAPALQATKPDLAISLKDGAATAGHRRSRLQNALVIAQVALSLVLLVGAGLVVRTMRNALTVDRGFEDEKLLLASFDLSIQGYTEPQGKLFYSQIIPRLESLPGVISASLAKTVPPNDWSDRMSVFFPGQEPPQDVLRGHEELGARVDANRIAPHYFQTLSIPLLGGREFTEADREGAPPVAIINEKLARHLWPGENPLGKRLAAPFLSGPPRPPVEIIGVAKDTKHRSLLLDVPLLLYLPESQAYDGRATIVVRTGADPKSVIPAIRREVAALDKNLPLFAVKTMREQIAGTLWQQRLAADLIGLFGLLALLLAAVGLYGLMAHFVAQRTHEIGIHMALGARPPDVLRRVLQHGMRLILTGVFIGLMAAGGLTRLMKSLLYGVSATDSVTYGGVTLLLTLVALLACYLPARRAMKVDPLVALRHE